MSDTPLPPDVVAAIPEEFRRLLAEDLEMLIRLHDRELDAETVLALQSATFPEGLALLPASEREADAYAVLAEAVRDLGQIPLDALAADYAAIYLTGAAGASPYESVWLTDEHLAADAPMFALRALYRAAGLTVGDWRQRYDDHLVLQLQYLRHALRAGSPDWAALARALDEHLLLWLDDFTAQVVKAADTAFYAGLALVTSAWCNRFRELLVAAFGLTRADKSELLARRVSPNDVHAVPVRFMPGAAPNW